MTDVEIAVEIDDILKILGWSRRKFYNHREELLDSGVIHYVNVGRPPRKKTMAFPSRIKTWIGIKASKGEIL